MKSSSGGIHEKEKWFDIAPPSNDLDDLWKWGMFCTKHKQW
jgi:hypothetical protein